MSIPPLLQAERARIALHDAVVIESLTFTSEGDRVLCVGDTSVLFATLMGVPVTSRQPSFAAEPFQAEEEPERPYLAGGVLRIDGHDPSAASHGSRHSRIGAAALDPPIPRDWTAEDYVTWSARLGGCTRRTARDLAHDALVAVGLERVSKKLARRFSLAERRVLLLAHSIVLSPQVLIAEAPLSGLEGAEAGFVMAAIAKATEGRRTILSATRIDPQTPEGMLAQGASYVAAFSQGALVFEGTGSDLFSGRKILRVTVCSNAEAFCEELRTRGIDLRGGPVRFCIALPDDMSHHDILQAARNANAALIELAPAFS